MSNVPAKSHPEKFVVVGAGQIGRPLAARLASLGHAVVWVSRTTPATIPAGVVHRSIDAADGAALAAVAKDAVAILAAVNPAIYDADVWARTLPPLHRGLIDASARSGKRLVVLDALYAYTLDEGPLSPTTRMDPSTAKGAIRKEIAALYAEANRSDRARTVLFRASDFWGPELTSALLTGDAIAGLARGKRPIVLGDPDAEHAFSHRDDVIDGMIALALAGDDVDGCVFHAPVVHVSPRVLVHAFARASGTTVEPIVVPRWLLRVLGVFSKSMRGMIEMLPQWESPYRVDDSGFRARFGASPTSLEEGVRFVANSRRAIAAG